MANLAAELKKRFEAAKSRKTNWESLYRDALDHTCPYKQQFNMTVEGQDKTNPDKVFDATAPNGVAMFVSNMQASLVPIGKRWVNLSPGPQVPDDKQDAARGQLQKITGELFKHMGLSNMDTEVSTAFHDLAYGTAALLIPMGTKDRPLSFKAVPIHEIYLEEGPNGRVDTAFRNYKVPYRHIENTWPDATVPEALTRKAMECPDETLTVIEGSLAGMYSFNEEDDQGKVQAVKRYGYRYVVMDESGQHILVDRLQRSSPWVIFRWQTLPGELYGRGPVLNALPDVKSINKVKELLLKAASRALFGVWLVEDDGVINVATLNQIRPGMVIPVARTMGGNGSPLMELPFQGQAGVQLGQFVLNDLQNGINKTLLAEPFGRVDLPVKSATEISLRQQEMARRMGSAYGRVRYEFLIPLLNRCLYILDELELIDLGGFLVDGQVIDVDFVSPLAQSQDLEDLQAMQGFVAFCLQTFGPQMGLAMFRPEVVSRKMAELLDLPTDILYTAEEVATMKQAMAQQVAQQSALQTAQAQAGMQEAVGQQEAMQNAA